MTRRDLFSIGAATLVARPPARAQNVYPGTPYRNYSSCHPDYLRELAEHAYRLRNSEMAKLTTPEAVEARRRWARKTFWDLVGGQPERTPLNPRTVGSFERPGYKVEKVIYESRPGFLVTANLYIPTAFRPPYPGILFQAGHTELGKAADLYQRCCLGLVKQGYLVLSFDPIGQGERIYYPGPGRTRSRVGSSTAEHTFAGRQAMLLGDTATKILTWDAVRSMDYLAGHPLVDPKRLGTTGNSGGGTMSMYFSAVEDRLSAVVACCPNSENFACANFNPPGSTADAEQNFLMAGQLGFDRWDALFPLAPKPLLIAVSDRDFFGTYASTYLTSGWEEFQKLKKVYDLLGKGNQLGWASTPLPHGLSHYLRLQVYGWFNRWLKGDRSPAKEPPLEPEKEEALWVCEKGTVLSLKTETPFTLTRKRAASLKPAAKPDLRKILAIDQPPPDAVARVLRRVPAERAEVETIEVQSASKVWVPAWLTLPREEDKSKPAVLILDASGRAQSLDRGLNQDLAAEGCPVCMPDLRAQGDLLGELPRGAARYTARRVDEDAYAWASLMLGKPLLGQRVTDILALLRGLRSHPSWSGRKVVVAASQKMTVPAQIAAALDPGVHALLLSGGLASFRNIVETEDWSADFVNFTVGFLQHTDLPDITASLAPRKVLMAGAVDGASKRMDPASVRRAYAGAHVEVIAEPAWDAAAIRKLWT